MFAPVDLGRRFISSIAVGCWLVAAASRGFAQAEISTQIDACVPIDRERFQRLLAIELGDAIQYSAAEGRAASPIAISLGCVAAGIELRLEDPVTRKSMQRTVDLEQVEPASRTRLMALTVAEFLVASWVELRLPRGELVPTSGPEPPPALPRAAGRVLDRRLPPRPPTWQLMAAAELIAFGDDFQLVPGLALRLSHRLSNSFELSLGVQLGRADLSGSLGPQPVTVQLTTISLLAGVLYAASFGDFTPSAGLGARFGMAYLGALTPAPGLIVDSAHNAWGGPVGMLGLRYRALTQLHVVVAFEVGLLAMTTNAVAPPNEDVLKLEHVWLGASLGLGWAF